MINVPLSSTFNSSVPSAFSGVAVVKVDFAISGLCMAANSEGGLISSSGWQEVSLFLDADLSLTSALFSGSP